MDCRDAMLGIDLYTFNKAKALQTIMFMHLRSLNISVRPCVSNSVVNEY